MPHMPEKALQLSQLTLKKPSVTETVSSSDKPDSTQIKSAHEVLPATWIDPTSQQPIEGFFKRVTTPEDSENNYPILLAKYDVAISVFMRMWLGETAAEDQLVFDAEGHIIGTFSKKLLDYKPMGSGERPLTADEAEPELVFPKKVETLLEHNVARLLTAEWGIGNPDVHPYNISIKGQGSVLDYDECLPRYTLIIKGGEGFLKWLEEKVVNPPQRLAGEDLNTFPILSEAHKRKHWPAQPLPGTQIPGISGKEFQSYETFMKLAAMSHVRVAIAPGKEVSFQEQMFESLLTMLLTYEPDMLRARLTEHLGDLPLDFMTLPDSRKEALCACDMQLFNDKTDKSLFVDHMMEVFQQQYDELYRAVVFYQGFKPQSKSMAPVVSFVDFLRNRPSARRKTMGWAKAQNELFAFALASQFNLRNMEDRYAQIWRDAHLIQFWMIWHELIKLVLDVANELKIEPDFLLPDVSFKMDDKITSTGQVIASLDTALKKLQVFVNSDPESKVTLGLESLIEFLIKLTCVSVNYFNSTRTQLMLEATEVYLDELRRLPQAYYKNICSYLTSTDWAGRFVKQARELDLLYGNLRLDLHKSSNDDELTAPIKRDYTVLLNRSHKDSEVVDTFISAFFDWANHTPRYNLISLISKVKDSYEEATVLTLRVPRLGVGNVEWKLSNPLTCRYRGPEIALYLKSLEGREDVKGDDILAYVLSTGECKSNSLNTSIVTHILPLVLRWRRGFGGIDNVNLMSLDNALSAHAVDYIYYTQKIVEYVRTAAQFTHIYSRLSQMQFNKAMYVWVNSLSRDHFFGLVNQALNEYEPENKPDASYATMMYGFFRVTARTVAHATVGGAMPRRMAVLAYFQDKNLTNAGILGSIFKEGGIDEPKVVPGVKVSMTNRPLNLCLFDFIFDGMKHYVSTCSDEEIEQDQDLKIILKIDHAQAKQYIHFSSFKACAKQYSTETKVYLEQPQPEVHSTPLARAASK